MANQDKFLEMREGMRGWLDRADVKQCARALSNALAKNPMTLIEIGKTEFAERYRSYVMTELHRRTLPGELKAVLRLIPGITLFGDGQRELCKYDLDECCSERKNAQNADCQGIGSIGCERHSKFDLFDFAYFYDGCVDDLASIALAETWTVDSRYKYGVLKSYLRNTFKKLWNDGLVVEKNNCAAFNTGLVDRHYDPIVAYFVPNYPGQRQSWRLKFFCTWGSGPAGKECVANLKQLPQTARWFTNFSQVFLEPDAEIVRSWEHFAYDNMARIPLDVLKDCGSFSETILNLLKKYPSDGYDEDVDQFIEGFKMTLDNEDLIDRFDFNLRAKFEFAIELAMKKVRWNFTSAVPMFFPTKRTFSFLLPLSLGNPKDVDVALVIDRVKDAGAPLYQAQTILTLSMAYTNARLLRRPDASWLIAFRKGCELSKEVMVVERGVVSQSKTRLANVGSKTGGERLKCADESGDVAHEHEPSYYDVEKFRSRPVEIDEYMAQRETRW